MPPVFVAVDDTDSPEGGCTTHLTFNLIAELTEHFSLVGYPRLVRLNPTVPWKTRGNGATVFFLSRRGRGKAFKVGERGGAEITSWTGGEGEPPRGEVLSVVKRSLEEVARRWRENSPGCVVGVRQPSEELYWRGAREVVERGLVERYLNQVGALWWGGRGVTGAACASAWRGEMHTYEVLAYRREEMWGREREIDEEEVKRIDALFPTTFNNYDSTSGHICIKPSTPCPVLLGIRGTDPRDLLKAYRHLSLEEHEGYLIYLTNQGSDHHLIPLKNGEPSPGGSYIFPARVVGKPHRERGGHVFVEARGEGGFKITLAAFRQTGTLRDVVNSLLQGDRVVVAGSVDTYPGTLNLEKLAIVETVPLVEKVANPICPECGRRMKSSGRDGYRCPGCGMRVGKDAAEFRFREREHLKGIYEASVSARRHLSRPLKLMTEEEKKRFVNFDF